MRQLKKQTRSTKENKPLEENGHISILKTGEERDSKVEKFLNSKNRERLVIDKDPDEELEALAKILEGEKEDK